MLQDKDPRVRESAVNAFNWFAEYVAPPTDQIAVLLRDEDARVRATALRTLRNVRIQKGDHAMPADCIRLLEDSDP